jgi:AcrR family transcriptional regulator
VATPRTGTPAQGRELRARGERTVRRLLDAGIQVFGRRGFHSARVDDIVKVAKTSHGTFYLYFANKEELFAALAADVSDAMVALAESLGPLDDGPDGHAELERWLGEFAALYGHYGPVIRTWTEAEVDNSQFGRLGTDMFGMLTATLARRIAETSAESVDPAIAALALLAMIERFNYFVLTGQVDADDDRAVSVLADLTHASLFGGERQT